MNLRIINDITNYIFVADQPHKADVILLPGGSDPAIPEKAVELFVNGGGASHRYRSRDGCTGGKILIPAFALGRAQEVILILKRAISKGKLSKNMIYVDGMVREVCRMYRLNPNYLRPNLAKRIFKGTDIFFNDWNDPVMDKTMREELAKSSDPCNYRLSGRGSPRRPIP